MCVHTVGQFGKYHNTLCLSPQILHKHCFCFLLGPLYVPRETGNNAYAKFWGTNKEYYGIFRTGLLLGYKIIITNTFQFNQMQDLPENHFWVIGASWVNIIKLQYNICFSMFCAHLTVCIIHWLYRLSFCTCTSQETTLPRIKVWKVLYDTCTIYYTFKTFKTE